MALSWKPESDTLETCSLPLHLVQIIPSVLSCAICLVSHLQNYKDDITAPSQFAEITLFLLVPGVKYYKFSGMIGSILSIHFVFAWANMFPLTGISVFVLCYEPSKTLDINIP